MVSVSDGRGGAGRGQSERARAPGLVWAEALSVGDEGRHLQEGAVVLGATGGQPGKLRL